MRPASIVTFDRLYLVSIGLGLVNSALSIDHTRAMIAADPALALVNGQDALIYASIALSVVVPLLLWHLIAHRGNRLAKWILIALTVLALINLPREIGAMGPNAGLGLLVTGAVEALRLVAITFLFRADARTWLGKRAG